MRVLVRKIARVMPRNFKNALLRTRFTRTIVWKLYGLASAVNSNNDNGGLSSLEITLLKRAVDDLLIEVRLMALRLEVLEEKQK